MFTTAVAWIWCGLLFGVSFIATPAKFGAPTLPMTQALDVGRVTFSVLMRVEIVALAILIATFWRHKPSSGIAILFVALVVAMLAQYSYMLPILDGRVEQIMQGERPAPSMLHTVYAVVEGAKVVFLFTIGLFAYKAADKA